MSTERRRFHRRGGRAGRGRAWVLGAVLVFAFAVSAPAPAAAPPPGVVAINPIVRGRAMPSGFVGLSIEYRALLTYLGDDPGAINPVFVRLLRNLAPGQDPILRIGGDSTDWTWWPVPDMSRPPGITYDITPSWIAVARALALETNARYIFGINLEANSPRIESAESHALLAGVGRGHVDALELGNEPELYSKLGWYRSGSDFIPGRPPGFGFQGFTDEFSKFRTALSPVPTAGPSSGSYWWLKNLPDFLAAEPKLGLVTVHSYWLDKCLRSPGLPGYPTVPNLLNPHPPSRLAGNLTSYAALAHAHGVPIRIDEMNSVTCGGKNGISNVFASALWVVNALFEAMSDGVDGVNIHTFPGTANQLFSFTTTNGQWLSSVRPEYYGLLMFAQAAPPGSKLLRIGQSHDPGTRVWATVKDGVIHVVLINDSLTTPSGLFVQLPSGGAIGQLERLLAPSPYAVSDITLAGQSFGAETATGTLAGPKSIIPLSPLSATGSFWNYGVTLPPATAAMITIR